MPVLVVALTLLWFLNLEYVAMLRPDEGRYAEIAREMLASGDWISPRLNDILYFEKPPLQYWITAIVFRVFGEDEWTARLWTATAGFAGVLLTYGLGKRLYGTRTALFAASVLASSALYGAMGHIATLDMGLAFLFTLTLTCFVFAETTPRRRRQWLAAAWIAIAAAVMSKGLIGLVLPAGAFAAYALLQRDWALPRRLLDPLGIALFVALAAPWFIVMSFRHPEFASFFFVHEHFSRFTSTVHQRTGPLWYFVPVLVGGMLPWCVFLPGAISDAFRTARIPRQALHPERLLLCVCGFTLVFFSVSGSKLAPYVLPVFPAMALLVGRHLARLTGGQLALRLVLTVLLAALLVVVASFVPRFLPVDVPDELRTSYLPWVVLSAVTLLALAALSFAMCMRRHTSIAVITLALGGLLFQQLAFSGYQVLTAAVSFEELGERLEHRIPRDAPVYAVDYLDAGLPFYLKRPVTLVHHAGELDFGLSIEPWKWIAEEADFIERWGHHATAFAVMRYKTFERLRASGLAMTVIDEDRFTVVVARRSPDSAGD